MFRSAKSFLRYLIVIGASFTLHAQMILVRPAPTVNLPTHIDGNSPSFWNENGYNMFSSTGNPQMISTGEDQFGTFASRTVDVALLKHSPVWIEAARRYPDGTIFGWYHHEPAGVCGSSPLSAPKIGAVISRDGGKTIEDLGIVLEAADKPDCDSKNGFFAGGHGDFSVVPDREGRFFYFYFTSYGGPSNEQGIATARLAFEDRFNPAGAVWKYHQGEWAEPGLGGRVSPVFIAHRSWLFEDTDSFWGPAVHFNTELQQYVMLLNRTCCEPGWPQEGIYLSINADPGFPSGWAEPERLIDATRIGYRPGYYPQIIGTGHGETDTLAGSVARLYIHGISNWELVFYYPTLPEFPPINGNARISIRHAPE